jgi:hypothetical protein
MSSTAPRLDQAFIFIVSVLIAFGLSWHVYSSWVGVAINTGVAALVAALGVREVRGLQPQFQRHRWVRGVGWGGSGGRACVWVRGWLGKS